MTLAEEMYFREISAREDGEAKGRVEGLEAGRAEGLEAGRAEGLEAGLNRVNRLNENLINEERFEDMKRAAVDPDYQEKLFKEFRL